MAIRVSVNDNDFIEVVVEDFAEFVQTWAPFLSATGIFVPTHQILLTGERCSIGVQLLDGFPLIQAHGEIVWTRDSSSAALGPSGAAIRLEEVDAAGRDLIERIEDRYVFSGGQRFDVDSPRRKQAEAVLIPEPDAELLKEATLGTLRESTSERHEGVMSINAGQQSPRFAPGMGSADEMRGGTMAPIQSGVWRALRVDDLPGGSKPRSGEDLGAPDRAQAALDALDALDRMGEGATSAPEAPPTGLAPSAGAVDSASGTPPASGASEEAPWGGGLLADEDWDFYEDERPTASGSGGDPTTEPPAAAAADEGAAEGSGRSGGPATHAAAGPVSNPSAAKGARPQEVEPIAAAAVRPTAPEVERAEDNAVRSATPARAHATEPAAPSNIAERDPSDARATPRPGAGRDPGSSSPTRPVETGPSSPSESPVPSSPSETPARPSASTSPAEVRPLHDVAAMRDATPEDDSDSPLWSEPLEAPPAAPRKHAFFEVDDLFRIDDEKDLEAELRESAMRVSRTISALSLPEAARGGEAAGDADSGARPAAGPKASEPAPGDERGDERSVAGEEGEEDDHDDADTDVVVFERDLERALSELNAPAPDPEPEEDDHDADAVVFERDLERALSELTGSHPRVELPAEETVPASASASEASEPERRPRRAVEESPLELFAPPQVEAPESEDPDVQAAPPVVGQVTPEVAGPVEREAPTVAEAPEESPVPVSLEREPAPPLPFERPAAPAGRQPTQGQPKQFGGRPAPAQPKPSGPRPATPTTQPAAASPGPTPFERPRTEVQPPRDLGGARPQEESASDGAESGLSSIDEALAEPMGPRRHEPRPIARREPSSSRSEPIPSDPAFENVSSEFLRASRAGLAEPGRESAAEGAASAAPEVKRDPMHELAESVGGQSWAPWASEPKARRFEWPSLAAMSGPLRIAGLLILAPLFVVLYLAVQQCYGEPVRDASEVPTMGPRGRMTLADSRIILETPGKSLWDLVQEGGLPEVDLLVTTPVGQAARRLVSFGAEAVDGGTIVTLEGDGTFGPVSTVHLRLDRGPPREVLKIAGIVDPPGGSELAVSTAEVERLRFGYHLRRQYNELQVVADLTSPDVRLVEITVERRSLVLRFESRPVR
ncbi:MAG TPA: hypothetical protein VMT85_14005 [Thermoanaerobaculia bacterium]|nr:hypothetical protein [Thermoanaerobaculia bacterium]